MTGAAIRFAAPTRTEQRLLALAARLTALVERRILARAARRERMIRQLATRGQRGAEALSVEHLLAQSGLPRR